MTKAAPHHHYTLRDYLDVELASPNLKHEFVDGEIYAMAGGTVEHAALAGAIITAWTRRGSEWELAICEAGARARVASLNLELDVDEIYETAGVRVA